MTDIQSLRIAPATGGAPLTPRQEQFNQLVLEVADWRTRLSGWDERIARCDQALEPLRRQVLAALRQWVLALDTASLQPELSRRERDQLGELVRDAGAELLGADGGDAEIAAVLAQHGSAAAPDSADVAVAGSGEAGTRPDSPTEPSFEALEAQWQQAADAAAAARERRAAARRAASRHRRASARQEDASQSVRDVYRRLASTLHPDREADARLRERKTALMQQANRAYAEDNLLALLEMQWQAEQIDARRLANLDTQRLDHYVIVLREQLAQLQRAAREREAAFRASVGAPPGSGMPARKADRLVSAEAQRLRADADMLQRQARLLRDAGAVREWLRALRQA